MGRGGERLAQIASPRSAPWDQMLVSKEAPGWGKGLGRFSLLPDTHAHLDASVFAADLDAVLGRAQEAGVDRILAVGTDLASSHAALALASRFEIVYAAIGIHPHNAAQFEEEADEARGLLTERKVVAVGEIGLDYYRDWVPPETQRVAFREQVRWAEARGLPVSVHNREADADVLAVLAGSSTRAILHCFSGSWEFARAALDASLYLSFGGNLTFPNAHALRGVAGKVAIDRALLESDSPLLAPQRWRGKRNEPAYLVATLEALAEAQNMSVSTAAETVSETASILFSWRAL